LEINLELQGFDPRWSTVASENRGAYLDLARQLDS